MGVMDMEVPRWSDSEKERTRAAHRALSEADWAFREQALTDPETWCDRHTFAAVDVPSQLFDQPFQPWPLWIEKAWLRHVGDVTARLADLIRSIPWRLFDGDARKICEFYGYGHPMTMELLLAEPNAVATTVGRADFIHGETSMQLLEINLHSGAGGWEVSGLRQRLSEVPVFERYLEDTGLDVSFTHPQEELVLHLVATAKDGIQGLDEPVNIAIVQPPDSKFPDLPEAHELLDEGLRRARLRDDGVGQAFLCRAGDPRVRSGRVWLDGTPIHAFVDITAARPATDVFRCFKGGRVCLFNGPLETLLCDKRNVALLSERAAGSSDDGCLEEAERDLVNSHVPWTRLVRPGEVDYRGETVRFPDFLLAARDRLVLKGAQGASGDQVRLGCFLDDAAWSREVDQALAAGDWVVQERVETRPYLFQTGDRGCARHDLIWGPYLFGTRYGGMYLRMQPGGYEGPVNLNQGASVGAVFEL